MVATASRLHALTATNRLLFSTPQITTASSLSSSLRSELKRCPSNVYVIAQQPGVSSADFTTSGATPHLKRWVSGHEETVGSSFGISEVIGSMEIASLEQILEQDCGAVTIEMDASTGLVDIAKAAKPRVIKVAFQVPAKGEQRRTTLRENGMSYTLYVGLTCSRSIDLFLSNLIDMLPTSDYTVLYTTSPVAAEIVESVEEPTLYEMDHHMDPLGHMELKRDNGIQARATNDSVVLPEGPLFERYQFFTPGMMTLATCPVG